MVAKMEEGKVQYSERARFERVCLFVWKGHIMGGRVPPFSKKKEREDERGREDESRRE
jgi:hypothetical protein